MASALSSSSSPVPCSLSALPPTSPPPPTDAHSFAQFCNLLREVYTKQHKFCRRGIHLHVQYRDVHEPGVGSSYLNYPYTESYLRAIPPQDDLNVWGDGLNESLWPHLPPHDYSRDSPDPRSASRKRHNDDAGAADLTESSSPSCSCPSSSTSLHKRPRRRSISQVNNCVNDNANCTELYDDDRQHL